MILKRYYLLLLIFPVITDTINADGTGVYIGGDISSVKLNIGHPSINHQIATGYHLLIGGKSENWEVEAYRSKQI